MTSIVVVKKAGQVVGTIGVAPMNRVISAQWLKKK